MNNVEYLITLLNEDTICYPSAAFLCRSDRASPVMDAPRGACFMYVPICMIGIVKGKIS